MSESLFPDLNPDEKPDPDGFFDPRTRARRDDPETSKEAARKVQLGERMAEALSWLKKHPGSTAAELEQKAGVSDGRIRKRLADLRRIGKARQFGTKRCRVTGFKAGRWWLS